MAEGVERGNPRMIAYVANLVALRGKRPAIEPRENGGPLEKDKTYTINESQKETVVGADGSTSTINDGKPATFTAKQPGYVLPDFTHFDTNSYTQSPPQGPLRPGPWKGSFSQKVGANAGDVMSVLTHPQVAVDARKGNDVMKKGDDAAVDNGWETKFLPRNIFDPIGRSPTATPWIHSAGEDGAVGILNKGMQPSKIDGTRWFWSQEKPENIDHTSVNFEYDMEMGKANIPEKGMNNFFREANDISQAPFTREDGTIGKKLNGTQFRIEKGKAVNNLEGDGVVVESLKQKHLVLKPEGWEKVEPRLVGMSGAGADKAAGKMYMQGKYWQVPGTGQKILSGVGKVAVPLGIANSAYDIYNAKDKPREVVKQAGGWVGGWAGAEAGAAGGAALGATIGSVVPVLGTAVGGAIGGFGGALIGGYYGSDWGKKGAARIYDGGGSLVP